jgi:Domain of unknown function (DUF4394)/IPT/TIG domain
MKNGFKTVVRRLSMLAAMVLFCIVNLVTNVGVASAQTVSFPPPCTSLPVSQPIVALDSNNTLFTYNPSLGSFVNPVQVTDIKGNLEGIDFRPANNLLYGITDTDQLYIIDPASGATKFVSTLPTSFDGGFQSLMDFNPVVNALRLIGSNDQNLAVANAPGADLSVTNPQLSLVYADGDRNEGVDPNITAGAYTNNVPNATQTVLYNIDPDKDVLTIQSLAIPGPNQLVTGPNQTANGINRTIGALGVNFAPVAGMDIYTNPQTLANNAVAVSGSTLYCVSLDTGAATVIPPLNPGVAPPLLRVTGDSLIDVAVSTATVQNNQPTITGFSLPALPGGSWVTIQGTNLSGTTSVLFNGTPATLLSLTGDGPTRVSAMIPLNATTGLVTVNTTAGSATSAINFIVGPTITGFSPIRGPVGTKLSISGANFSPGNPSYVSFPGFNPADPNSDAISAPSEFVSSNQIRATVPVGAVTGKIEIPSVNSPFLMFSRSPNDFVVTP